tara:strand:+ start:589 stop:1080 length:492 start_codon:yes stop_codon:yes gene_type:complete
MVKSSQLHLLVCIAVALLMVASFTMSIIQYVKLANSNYKFKPYQLLPNHYLVSIFHLVFAFVFLYKCCFSKAPTSGMKAICVVVAIILLRLSMDSVFSIINSIDQIVANYPTDPTDPSDATDSFKSTNNNGGPKHKFEFATNLILSITGILNAILVFASCCCN